MVGRTQRANREPRFLIDITSKSAIAAASLIERRYDSGMCLCQPGARLPIIESCLHWPRICKRQLTASRALARTLSQATPQATEPRWEARGNAPSWVATADCVLTVCYDRQSRESSGRLASKWPMSTRDFTGDFAYVLWTRRTVRIVTGGMAQTARRALPGEFVPMSLIPRREFLGFRRLFP